MTCRFIFDASVVVSSFLDGKKRKNKGDSENKICLIL